MAFTPKNWEDAPSTATPLSAAALEDLETRLAAYSDTAGGAALLGIDPTGPAYGADKTGSADATNALRAARAAALPLNMPVILPPGTYTISGRIHDAAVTSNPVKFAAAVPGTVTIQRTASVPIIDVQGTRGTAVALSANVAAGAVTCTTATLPTGLVANDYVQLRSNAIFSGLAVMGEVLRVKTIAGTGPYTITFYGRTEEAYLTADSAVIEKLNLVAGSRITGIKFRQTAMSRDSSGDALVQLTLTRDDLVERCAFQEADSPGIEPRSSIDWVINECTFDHLQAGAYFGYGVNIADGCRDGFVLNCRARYVRDGVTTGADAGQLAPRHITVDNFHVSEPGSAGLDTHAEGKHITFSNCHMHHGAGIQVRAPYTTVVNPTIVGYSTTHGAGILIQSPTATNCTVRGGFLTQLTNDPPILCNAEYAVIDGVRIVTTATSLNGTHIAVNTHRSTIRNVDSHLYDNDAVSISYSGGVGHILDGGTFRAATARNVVNIASSTTTVTVLNKPYRDSGHGPLAFATGAGRVVYFNDTNRMRSSGAETIPRFATIPGGNTVMVNGRIYGVRTNVEDGGVFTNMRIAFTGAGSGLTQFRVGVWDANTLALLIGSGDVTGGVTVGVGSFALGSIGLVQGQEIILGAVAAFATTGPTMRGGSTSAGLAGLSPALTWSLAGDTYTTGALPALTTSARFGDVPWLALT